MQIEESKPDKCSPDPGSWKVAVPSSDMSNIVKLIPYILVILSNVSIYNIRINNNNTVNIRRRMVQALTPVKLAVIH